MGRFGPEVMDVTKAQSATIAIAGETTVYTDSFSLKNGVEFALHYKAASSGNIKLTIQLEQGYARPTTEGSSDSSWAIPEGAADIHTALADANQHIIALTGTKGPAALPYGRFKITGLGAPNANDASTTIRMRLGKLEDI